MPWVLTLLLYVKTGPIPGTRARRGTMYSISSKRGTSLVSDGLIRYSCKVARADFSLAQTKGFGCDRHFTSCLKLWPGLTLFLSRRRIPGTQCIKNSLVSIPKWLFSLSFLWLCFFLFAHSLSLVTTSGIDAWRKCFSAWVAPSNQTKAQRLSRSRFLAGNKKEDKMGLMHMGLGLHCGIDLMLVQSMILGWIW